MRRRIDVYCLEWAEALRRRPEMYVGGRGQLALHWLLRGLVELPLRPTRMSVTVSPKSVLVDATCVAPSLTPRTKFRIPFLVDVATRLGAPLDQPPTISGVEYLDVDHHPARFMRADEVPWALALANALGSSLVVGSHRNGESSSLQFERGRLVSGPIVALSTRRDGMTIGFTPDDSIFEHGVFRFQPVASLLRDFAVRRRVDVAVRDDASGHAFRVDVR